RCNNPRSEPFRAPVPQEGLQRRCPTPFPVSVDAAAACVAVEALQSSSLDSWRRQGFPPERGNEPHTPDRQTRGGLRLTFLGTEDKLPLAWGRIPVPSPLCEWGRTRWNPLRSWAACSS